MNRILQFTISYLGLLPYTYYLSDLYIFKLIDPNIIMNMIIFNTIIIYTFIGAIHWQWLQKMEVRYIQSMGLYPVSSLFL